MRWIAWDSKCRISTRSGSSGHARCPVKAGHTFLADFREAPDDSRLTPRAGKIVIGSETLARLDYDDCLQRTRLGSSPQNGWERRSPAELPPHLASAGRPACTASSRPAGPSQALKRNGRRTGAASFQQMEQAWDHRRPVHPIVECLGEPAWQPLSLLTPCVQAIVVLPTGAWFTPRADEGWRPPAIRTSLTLDVGTSQFGQAARPTPASCRSSHYLRSTRKRLRGLSEKAGRTCPGRF